MRYGGAPTLRVARPAGLEPATWAYAAGLRFHRYLLGRMP